MNTPVQVQTPHRPRGLKPHQEGFLRQSRALRCHSRSRHSGVSAVAQRSSGRLLTFRQQDSASLLGDQQQCSPQSKHPQVPETSSDGTFGVPVINPPPGEVASNAVTLTVRRESKRHPGDKAASATITAAEPGLQHSLTSDSHLWSSDITSDRQGSQQIHQRSVAAGAAVCGTSELAAPPAAGSVMGANVREAGPKGSVLAAVALITGSTVGAGILALPASTAPAGFGPSAGTLATQHATPRGKEIF